ncbi:hypothetical protein KIL84_021685 [Mauremys mutica]|uniref:Uncharacterized protein n=1 Tax=Mauremys mutica TaxID=74926 RepID=A0A9D3X963_9SAUR|nr:hypothetical protein KIL84_021685 [Mauremys mutica]
MGGFKSYLGQPILIFDGMIRIPYYPPACMEWPCRVIKQIHIKACWQSSDSKSLPFADLSPTSLKTLQVTGNLSTYEHKAVSKLEATPPCPPHVCGGVRRDS